MIMPLLAVLVLPACASSTGPEGVLSEAELQTAVFSILNLAVVRPLDAVPGTGPVEGGPALAPVRYDSETIETFPCDLGGEVETLTRTVGFVDDETQNAEIAFLVELDHEGCIEGAGSVRVTLDGNPGLEASYEFDRQPDGSLAILGGIVGTVLVVTDDLNLNCRSNLIVNGTVVDDRIEIGFAGSLCETGVQGTIS